jgi:hypothetical protein
VKGSVLRGCVDGLASVSCHRGRTAPGRPKAKGLTDVCLRLDLLQSLGPEGDLEVVGASGRVLGVIQSDETVAVEA